jgi:hypothetical protein
MHAYEKWISRRYLAHALKAKSWERSDLPDEHLHGWIAEHGR